jgi:hypothetical protein
MMKSTTLKLETHSPCQQREVPFVINRPRHFLQVRHVGMECCFAPERQTYSTLEPPTGRIELTVYSHRRFARVFFRVLAASPVGFLGVRYEILDYFHRLLKHDETGWIPYLVDHAGNQLPQQEIEFPEPNKAPAEILLDLKGTDLLHPLWLAVYAEESDHTRMALKTQYMLWNGHGC